MTPAPHPKPVTAPNAAGTLTVFKYPNPSLYNQIKYFAVSRDAQGRVHTRFPNEGSFAGIGWRTRHGAGFAWLRDWRATQGWDSPDLPVPVTTYRSPKRLGLSVTVFDFAPPGGDAVGSCVRACGSAKVAQVQVG